MRVLVVVVGVLSAILVAGVALVTFGEAAAAIALVVVAAATLFAATVGARYAGAITSGLVVLLVAALGYAGWSTYSIIRALTDNSGPVDAPDPVALASGRAKIDQANEQAGFRIEMTADEIEAVLLDALSGVDNNPLRSIELQVVDGKSGAPGQLRFTGKFKGGGLEAKGSVEGKVESGRIDFKVRNVDLGNLRVPGLARGAVEDLVQSVTDLNKRLEENDADVQALEIGSGRVLVVGVSGSGKLVTLGGLLEGLRQNVAGLGAAATPPAETLGPGTVTSSERLGARYYIALGDSLAANVGVGSPAEGYASRFLRQLDARDGQTYGFRNFGISGQTSSGLLRGGQLDNAVKFMETRDIAYVTIDIGANDLLGHLYSADCADTLQTPACQQRLERTIVDYTRNLDEILGRVRNAAPKATIVFLGMYNPFSIGFGPAVGLEAETDAIVDRVNRVAAEAAAKNEVKFADGQARLRGRAGAVTHMLDPQPDIHPRGIGYDLLAAALVGALQ